jgi:hypothetical protein
MASVPGYFYATRGDTIYVNLFARGSADISTPAGSVKLAQETRYPWDGAITLTLTPDKSRRFALNIRVPGWARNQPVPTDLYRFLDTVPDGPLLRVNGQTVRPELDKGYVTVDRTWKPGDVVEFTLPMPVRRVVAHANVEADRDRVALQRGPIVYAAEWPDNPGGKVRNLVLPDGNRLTSEFRGDLLNGVQVVKGQAFGLSLDEKGSVVKKEQPLVLIPYATWANRGRGEMAVWLARSEAAARPAPYPTLAMASKITSSRENGQGWLQSIVEGDEPRNSRSGGSMFNWWPLQGWGPNCEANRAANSAAPQQRRPQCSKGEWIEMTFAKPSNVSEAEIYWFDDQPGGGVRVPASWKLLYKDGDEWKPVETADSFGVAKDAWNRIAFKPVTTSALRLEVVLQPGVSAGLQEWRVK